MGEHLPQSKASIVKNRTILCGGLALLVLICGCSQLDRDPLKTLNELGTAYKQLGDTLEGIRDAGTAEAALDELDARYSELLVLLRGMPEFSRKYKDFQVRQDGLDQVKRNIQDGATHWCSEQLRLNNVRGLPLRFWKIVKIRSIEVVMTAFDASQPLANSISPNEKEVYCRIRDLMDRCGYEQTASIEFENLPGRPPQAAFDKLLKLAPGSTLVHGRVGAEEHAFMGPVKDFHAFAAAIDFGSIVYEDDARRTVRVLVDPNKLGGAGFDVRHHFQHFGDTPRTDARPAAQEQLRKDDEDAHSRMTKKMEADRAARDTEENGDPSDPAYFETMADRMSSSDHFRREKAIDALLRADPATVSSSETKKKIARQFKEMAEGDNPFDHKKAIKGLALWAGKFSVPILLKMLAVRHLMDEELLIQTLGNLKDARAAPALTARLTDFRFHELAFNILNEMGSEAEDALLEVAPANDPKLCIAALTLLGNVGTEKSLGMMQKAQASRNPEVRAVGRTAAQKIRLRSREAKAAAPRKESPLQDSEN